MSNETIYNFKNPADFFSAMKVIKNLVEVSLFVAKSTVALFKDQAPVRLDKSTITLIDSFKGFDVQIDNDQIEVILFSSKHQNQEKIKLSVSLETKIERMNRDGELYPLKIGFVVIQFKHEEQRRDTARFFEDLIKSLNEYKLFELFLNELEGKPSLKEQLQFMVEQKNIPLPGNSPTRIKVGDLGNERTAVGLNCFKYINIANTFCAFISATPHCENDSKKDQFVICNSTKFSLYAHDKIPDLLPYQLTIESDLGKPYSLESCPIFFKDENSILSFSNNLQAIIKRLKKE